ncbi:hypothetical protein CGCS363_v006476 [Colletotrichum siamense]|uniref:uncharacterized protein n=1 Tax=Colletotrichum siamense TaxID=690259 RepID=UPI001872A6F2|nr:uncharacterized protein CGCS363_v006476 [Colletotrichum siamense]KAF5501765.1 hypothetical protein CGCS363_v006476 [Colletotrichum siamense]
MNPSSPAKRRALAPLDANVNAMSPKRQLHNKTTMPGSPLKSPIKSPLGLKRSLDTVIFDENSVVPKKKQCQEPVKVAAPSPAPALSLKAERESAAAASPAPAAPTSTSTPPPAPAQTEEDMPDAKEAPQQTTQEEPLHLKPEKKDAIATAADDEQTQRQQTPRRSASPATSSVFDNSAMDTSQNTTILTEPDQEQAARTTTTTTTLPPPRPRRLLTREEARQKARILRLKLGLANYKLQTGQEDVPLDRLQVKPLPGQEKRALPRVTVQPPSSRDGPPESEATIEADDRRDEETQEEEVVVTKPEKATLQTVPEETLTAEDSASPVCGGAVSSLLSLARASSSVSASS